ncbi:thrombospondin type 3 repeat-containing protein [Gammaproteobacteria bacterium]|nr:thrombospondin type 3 repeat-containing protein [Gammaproteobacteria bacterium]
MVTSKRRYTCFFKAGTGLATAFAFSISYGATPTISPLIEPDDDVLICDDLDDDGILDVMDNCFGFFNPSQIDANNNGIGDACEMISSGS